MSVRDGLLAILSLGPAYGLQLHSELASRAPHRGPVNVGQIYATLDRLISRGLAEDAGATTDGLPLYVLTAAGRRAAEDWASRAQIETAPDWVEMLDQVLITATIDPESSRSLAGQYRDWWLAEAERTALPADGDLRSDVLLARSARRGLAAAALAWLADVADAELDPARPLSPIRPRRGRRPAVRPSSAA